MQCPSAVPPRALPCPIQDAKVWQSLSDRYGRAEADRIFSRCARPGASRADRRRYAQATLDALVGHLTGQPRVRNATAQGQEHAA